MGRKIMISCSDFVDKFETNSIDKEHMAEFVNQLIEVNFTQIIHFD